MRVGAADRGWSELGERERGGEINNKEVRAEGKCERRRVRSLRGASMEPEGERENQAERSSI